MITRNSRPLRFMSVLLGASLSVALVSGAYADDNDFHDSDRHEHDTRVLQVGNGIDLTQGLRPVATAGVLVRSSSEIEARLAMSGLEANHAYTIWWMIFNKPQNCAVKAACSPADLTGPSGPDPEKIKAVGGTVFNGTGFIAASDGTANVTVLLKDGPLPIGNGIANPSVTGFLWPGNGLNAYIITIIRAHGLAEAGRMATQISQSEPAPAQGGTCADCFDHQAIIFGTASGKN
jgi:hypothetical protein